MENIFYLSKDGKFSSSSAVGKSDIGRKGLISVPTGWIIFFGSSFGENAHDRYLLFFYRA